MYKLRSSHYFEVPNRPSDGYLAVVDFSGGRHRGISKLSEILLLQTAIQNK